MSLNRTNPKAGYAKTADMKKGPNGRNLCRRCSTEVPPGKRTFCGPACIEAWRLTTDPTFLRRMTRRRDKGVCATCGLPTQKLEKAISELRQIRSRWGFVHPEINGISEGIRQILKALTGREDPNRTTFWDADHVVEVINGGGECGLENIQTLCVWCHRKKTARLARERAEARKTADKA
jgi:5-methylcytosine-specific restriction endonuclease McrA